MTKVVYFRLFLGIFRSFFNFCKNEKKSAKMTNNQNNQNNFYTKHYKSVTYN